MILFKGKGNCYMYCLLQDQDFTLYRLYMDNDLPIFFFELQNAYTCTCIVHIFFNVLYMYWSDNLTYITGEHCEMYVKHFEGLFGTDALAEMVAAS